MDTIKVCYSLTKPGIIYGNAITAAGGFFLASRSHINFPLLLTTLLGLSLVIASACVFNNFLDRDIDQFMSRTKRRALVTHQISITQAILFATSLGLAGLLILFFCTNLLTASVALTGFIFYVIIYTHYKRHTIHGTVLGSISGAVPPVVGYTAVTAHLDIAALILFLILIFWQMPHFYAIAIYRSADYAAAKIPVLPIVKGILIAKVHMLLYIIAFTIAAIALSLLGFAGHIYFTIATLLSLFWLGFCLTGFKTQNNNLWARRMFLLSLIVITVLFAGVSIDSALR